MSNNETRRRLDIMEDIIDDELNILCSRLFPFFNRIEDEAERRDCVAEIMGYASTIPEIMQYKLDAHVT